jgi:glycosyltransferase involved in cell wall biosynthesis
MKKILFFANSAWYLTNFKMGLMKRLEDIGYKVVLLAPQADYEIPFEFHTIKVNGKGRNPLQDAFLYLEIKKKLKEIAPDLVINYTVKPNVYATLAAKSLGIPSIINIAGLGVFFRKNNVSAKIIRFLYKLSSQKADFIFFQNKDDQEIFTQLYNNDKYHILPGSGVDLKKFQPSKFRRNEVFTFLFLGRLIREKGIFELIEAIQKVREKYNAELRILGFTDVDNLTAISKKEVQNWHDKGIIRYMGFTDNVCEYILDCDCVVLPSYYGEGVPKSLLEAASMAKPIITTDHIGCKEAVDDGITGFLCSVKNSDDLADKMLKMIELPDEELGIMGKNGRKKMENEFDEEIVISENIKQIKKLIGE